MLFALAVQAPPPVTAPSAMVSSPEANATDIGVAILKQGGNAWDAAAAVGFALAVTYPQAGNLGGGGFMVSLGADGNAHSLDFRETAPAAATRDMYLNDRGDLQAGKSTDTYLAAGVPGSVDGLLRMQARFGKLSRRQIVQPAVRLAQDGFAISDSLAASLAGSSKLRRWNSSRAVFRPGGRTLRGGDTLRQSDLAETLRLISDLGRSGFYQGDVAAKVAAAMRANEGIITEADMAGYEAKWRDPFVIPRGVDTIFTMPLPSSGGFTLAQWFGLADEEAMAEMPEPLYLNAMVEAERLAFQDRNRHLGDTDFVEVDVEKLTGMDYIGERANLLPEPGKAGKSTGPGAPPESFETTHYCVADAEGNVVAVTTTLNAGYGMGAVVPGAGFLLNNEMDDFAAKPGTPNMFGLVQGEQNAIQPGKRMLSSMTPTIVTRDGEFWMTIGSPGGPTIITTVLQVYMNMAFRGMNVREAIEAPRIHHQHLPDQVRVEPGLGDDMVQALNRMGYDVNRTGRWGQAAGIARQQDGSLTGWFDSRGDGKAAGY